MNQYFYEKFIEIEASSDQNIVLHYIEKKSITKLEIEYLGKILLNKKESEKNRLLAAGILTKLKDKDLIDQAMSFLKLAEKDENKVISTNVTEYFDILKNKKENK